MVYISLVQENDISSPDYGTHEQYFMAAVYVCVCVCVSVCLSVCWQEVRTAEF